MAMAVSVVGPGQRSFRDHGWGWSVYGRVRVGVRQAQLRSAAPALVELEVRLGLGLGGVEGGGLVDLEGVLRVAEAHPEAVLDAVRKAS